MPEESTPGLKLQLVLFTSIRTIINTGYRMVYPLMPLFASGLGVELNAIAAALSVRSFLGVIGPFLATVADTYGRKKGMLTGVIFFMGGCILVTLFPGFVTFTIASAMIVIGNGVFIPSMGAYLGDRVSYNKRGTVISITELSWALAFIVGVPIVHALILKTNWITPFIGLAGLSLLLGILLIWKVPEDKFLQKSQLPIFRNLKTVLSFWPALAGLLMGILFTGANETINLVFGDWIKSVFGISFATMTAASIVIGTSEISSELLSIILLDKLGKKRAILISLLLNCIVALMLPLTTDALIWALFGLAAFYITFEFALISTLTLMSEIMPQFRATVIAATVASFSIGRLLGDLISPFLYSKNFWFVCLATVFLNIVSLGFLYQVKINRTQQAS